MNDLYTKRESKKEFSFVDSAYVGHAVGTGVASGRIATKPTDLRINDVKVEFSDIAFRTPLILSSGSIEAITYARVMIEGVDRSGRVAHGRGGILLSDLWAFPSAQVAHDQRDAAMRRVCRELAASLKGGETLDPLQWGRIAEEALESIRGSVTRALNLAAPIPHLAGLVCLSPFDAAIHDCWGRLAGHDVYDMYTAEFLNEDLSTYLGGEFAGRYPGDFLSDGKQRIAVQHVVGGADRLWRREEQPTDLQDGIPNSLESWIEQERVHWFKLKSTGADVAGDLQRIVDVFTVATQTFQRIGLEGEIKLEIDPNEGCSNPEYLVELLTRLKETAPSAFAALRYIEQPTARDLSAYDFTLHDVSRLKPVVIDESLDRLSNLSLLDPLGFSGVALKACKGQTHTLLAYSWARANDLFVTVQDLTNPGFAHIQSAELARRLHLSEEALEYNSRQYIPHSCVDERHGHESLFNVDPDGNLRYDTKGPGLY